MKRISPKKELAIISLLIVISLSLSYVSASVPLPDNSGLTTCDTIEYYDRYGNYHDCVPPDYVSLPRQQIASGVAPEDVLCWGDLVLVIKENGLTSACVKPQTAEKLVQLGWALAKSSLQSQNLRMRIVSTSNDGCSIFDLEKIPLSEWEKYEQPSEKYYVTLLDDEINQDPDLREMIDAMKDASGFESVSYDEGLLVKRISGVDHGGIFYWLLEKIGIKTPAGFEHEPVFRYNDDVYTFGLAVC